jgi:hypothetical protein
VAREARLTAALAEVAAVAPTMVAADMRTGLDAALAAVPEGVVPCVFASHALLYLDAAGRTEVAVRLAAAGAARDLVVVTNEPAHPEMVLFAEPAPRLEPEIRVVTHITVVAWSAGAPSVEVLGEGDAHGAWLRYEPRGYAYRDPAGAA